MKQKDNSLLSLSHMTSPCTFLSLTKSLKLYPVFQCNATTTTTTISINTTSIYLCINKTHFQSQAFHPMSAITFQTSNTQSPHRMWTCNMHESGAGSSRFSTGGGSNHWISKLPVVKEEEDDGSTDSSSSIGVNSDGGDDVDGDVADGEVTSKDNNGPLGGLETALPIKRGISKFYAGKSKSYGSLADAVSVNSIQDIVKKEDAYSRKRKNMIAHTVLLEKLRNSSSDNGVSKRLARCAEGGETANTSSLTVGGGLPPLHRNGRRVVSDGSLDSSRGVYRSPWRSLSLSDLQHASGVTGLVSSKRDEEV